MGSAPPGEVCKGCYRLSKRGPRSARCHLSREGALAVLAQPSLAGGQMGSRPAQPAGSSGKGEETKQNRTERPSAFAG